MDSWEDDDYEVPSLAPVAIKSAWDDEEEEEEKVEKGPTQPSEKQVRSSCLHVMIIPLAIVFLSSICHLKNVKQRNLRLAVQ
jgi:hypothetical protein